MARFMAVLLAAFLCGPTCLCFAPAQSPPPQTACVESCCQALHDDSLPQKEPAPTCACNKCLVKRTLADASLQPPAATWTTWSPVSFDASHLFRAFPVPTLFRHLVTDTGPPHVPRADLVRHRALLL